MPRVDWSKAGLRTGYLIEGVVAISGNLRVVRWCGPKVRVGSGMAAYATLNDSGIPLNPNGAPVGPGERIAAYLASWEGRLSGCSYEKSLGGLRQQVQTISDVSVNVDIGSTDDADPSSINTSDLRDLVHYGTWRAQNARLIAVDLDDIRNFEVLASGTWDRNPDSVSQTSFRLTINAGEIIPPTLPWPSWQVPSEVPSEWDDADGHAPRMWPGGGVVLPYRLNPAHAGKFMGYAWGGMASGLPWPGVWAEVVPYGVSTTFCFALISPRFDQFAIDFAYETSDGEIVRVSEDTNDVIRIFNQTDPTRGPVGTCVSFSKLSPNRFFWLTSEHRLFAKILGGSPLSRPPGYTPVSEYGEPWLGDNMPTGGEASPDVPHAFDPQSETPGIFEELISNPHFLNSPGMLHPDAVTDLLQDSQYLGVNQFRTARIPLELTTSAPSFLNVVHDFMASIPADLTLRYDPASNQPKYYAKVRPRFLDEADYTLTAGDLAESDLPGVVLSSDPDGIYANKITFKTSFFDEPITTADAAADNELTQELQRGASLVTELESLPEQGYLATNITIEQTQTLNDWNFYSATDMGATAAYFLNESARLQKVTTATLGAFAIGWDLGDTARYRVPNVIYWPGQIRGLLLDLDTQTVELTLFHWKPDLRAEDPVVDLHETAENTARGYKPDRRRD